MIAISDHAIQVGQPFVGKLPNMTCASKFEGSLPLPRNWV
jgi:hypothetical protein